MVGVPLRPQLCLHLRPQLRPQLRPWPADLGQVGILAQHLSALADYLAGWTHKATGHSNSLQEQACHSTSDRQNTAHQQAPCSDAPHSDALNSDVETWFRELHPRVYAYIRYRVADLQEAEDLTSEIMERALTHLDSYDVRKGAFSTWLFRIAHNTLVNYWKRQQRQSQHQVDLGEGLEDLASDDLSPEQVLAHKEEVVRLLACVRTLSARQQDILSMRFAGRLTNREIASVLRMNERTVSVTILRALRTLRRKLLEQPDTVPDIVVPGEQRPVPRDAGRR